VGKYAGRHVGTCAGRHVGKYAGRHAMTPLLPTFLHTLYFLLPPSILGLP
jgi:hypothetical protein